MYHHELGNRGIIFLLTLVVHVLLIVISPSKVLWMRITNEQNSATMVTINLKVSVCRDTITNSNITKAYVVNLCDSCGDFSDIASCVLGFCDIPRTFSTVEPSKGPNKANNRLNSTWNTTRCEVASFFLFSLRFLPKVFRTLPVNVLRDLARAFSGIHARVYAEGSAL